MTNYYIKKDNKIILFDTELKRLQDTIAFMPQYKGLEVLETEAEIIEHKGGFVFKNSILDELLAQAKQEKIAQINDAKEMSFKEGIIFKDAHFDCDDRAQDRTGNRLLLLQALPVETLEWLDYNYQPVELTAQEFSLLCAAIFERIQFIEFKTGQLLDAVEAADSIEELEALEISFAESTQTI